MKHISILLIALTLLNCPAAFAARPLLTRSGTLETSEVWSGEVKVDGDVTVPKGAALTIEPGTKFQYDREYKLIVYGTLNVGGASLGEGKYDVIPLDPRTRIINVTPYPIDTTSLRDEFRIFRIQYAILWTVLVSSLIYVVAHR
ncbi:MAG TPA: hypothetical protein VMD02_03790 [Candidatus Omnitrophota bacterium]|nr:hypothetical protein [Candidatus Omnitrophota bacterium]